MHSNELKGILMQQELIFIMNQKVMAKIYY